MDDCIVVPVWIDFKRLTENSRGINDFNTTVDACIYDNKIDLTFLRKYYFNKKENAINLIDEFALRGFNFLPTRNTSILPDENMFEDKDIISVKNSGTNFLKINFELLGLGGFTNRFQVEDDLFFDKISISAFLYLNKGINRAFLYNEFVNNGFLIISCIDDCEADITEQVNRKMRMDKIENVLISHLFREGIFNNFNRYCMQKELKYLSDLEEFDFESLRNIRGFGKERIARIKERYFDKVICEMKSYEECSDTKNSANEDNADMSISKIFKEGIFNNFVTYCQNNNITCMRELEGFDFYSLQDLRGFGKGRIERIIEKYYYIYDNGETVGEFIKYTSGNQIHSDFKDIAFEFVFDENISTFFRNNGMSCMGDFETFNNGMIKNAVGIGNKKQAEVIEQIQGLSKSLDEYLTSAFEDLREAKGYEEFREVIFNKKTLEQVGKEKVPEVTGERIRQKKAKYEEAVLSVLLLCEEVLFHKGQLEKAFDFDTLSDLLGSYDNAIIARQIISDYPLKHINYIKEFDLFLIDADLAYIYAGLNDIAERLGDIVNFYDAMTDIEEMLLENEIDYIDVFSFPEYLLTIGYKKMNDFYLKGRISRESLYGIIVRQYFPDGIENNEDDISKLQDILLSEFGEEPVATDKLRNIWVKIERYDKNVLWGKSRKQHIDNVKLSDAALLKINDILTTELIEAPTVSADYLYQKCKPILEECESNIVNKESLYGVIQYYFKDSFAYKKLVVKAMENANDNNQIVLEKYVFDNGGRVNVKTIRSNFKWTDAMYSAAVNFNRNILSWNDNKELIHISTLNLSEEFIEQFYEKVQQSFIEGYTNGYMIAKKAQVLLLKNGITPNGASSYSLVKSLFEDKLFITRRPHILQEEQESQFTVSKLILRMFEHKTIVTYGEMKDRMINDYCFNEIMAGNHIAKELNELFQIDIDQYSLMSEAYYDENDVEAVGKQCEKLLVSKGYCLLEEFDRTELLKRRIVIGDKAIECNQYISKSIINKKFADRYRLIVRKGFDWRYDSTIVIPTESGMKNFADVLIHIVANEFTDRENCIISKIEQFLIERRIIYRKIPEEFFMSNIVTIDEFGRVTINT